MKKILIILTISTLFFNCSDNNTEVSQEPDINPFEGQIKKITMFQYGAEDDSGKVVKVNTGSYFGVVRMHLFDTAENEIENTSYNTAGIVKSKMVTSYDSNGNRVESTYYDLDGNITSKQNYKHDEKGNEIEVNSYNLDGSINWKTVSKYDVNGNEIEDQSFEANGIPRFKTINKYDNKGNGIESKRFSGSSLVNWEINNYDDKGNAVEIQFLDSDGKIKSIWKNNYDFDAKANWTRKIIYIDGKPKYIFEREIEYY